MYVLPWTLTFLAFASCRLLGPVQADENGHSWIKKGDIEAPDSRRALTSYLLAFGHPAIRKKRMGQSRSLSGRPAHMLAASRKGLTIEERTGEGYLPAREMEIVPATGEELPSEPVIRIGHGYEMHGVLPRDSSEGWWGKYEPYPILMAGVKFDEFELGVVSHTEGDVAYQSTADAILGALSLPDIGPRAFPITDTELLDEAVRLMELRGYRIGNIDMTIVADEPRLNAKHSRMKENIVRITHTVPARVNIKMRAHEKPDFECHVVIVLERSDSSQMAS